MVRAIPRRHGKAHEPLCRLPRHQRGDGGHHHPTQTLTDLLTIRHYKGSFQGLTVGVCGDLKFRRTIHSLVTCLSRYENVRFLFISPEELNMPRFRKRRVTRKGVSFTETTDLEAASHSWMSCICVRVQRERFISEEELRLKTALYPHRGRWSSPTGRGRLAPAARINEIATEVDDDRARHTLNR
ncbi:MAG: hypothetical protein R2912_11520 [Eubacteriales bacterium]